MNYLVILFLFSLKTFHPIDIKLANLQYKTGCNFKKTSINRTIGHNIKVNGSNTSYHLLNRQAYDVQRYNCELTYREIAKEASKIFNGVIVYDSHLHLDMRKERYIKL